jgi:hypothetical protein
VLTVGLAAAYFFLGLYLVFRRESQSTGSAGIGAVSVGISEALVPILVLVLLGPPIGLLLTWWFLRRSGK